MVAQQKRFQRYKAKAIGEDGIRESRDSQCSHLYDACR